MTDPFRGSGKVGHITGTHDGVGPLHCPVGKHVLVAFSVVSMKSLWHWYVTTDPSEVALSCMEPIEGFGRMPQSTTEPVALQTGVGVLQLPVSVQTVLTLRS